MASPSDNPGLTSSGGDDTPSVGHADVLSDAPLVQTPPTDAPPTFAVLGQDGHSIELDHSLPAEYRFSAQSAPASTYEEGLGPRLSKSAALRMGLQWEDPREARRVSGEEVPVDFDTTPGHKRSGLEVHVAALAEPVVAPRQNRAALLRAGQIPEEKEVRDRAEIAAANKAREAAERLEKRRSVQLPNRAALLRAGLPVEDASRTAEQMAERALKNKARDAAERAERRRSLQAPASLAAPPPRANRSSMLRLNKSELAPANPPRVSGEAARPVAKPAIGAMGPPPPRPPRSHARDLSRSSTVPSTTAGSTTSRSSSPSKAAQPKPKAAPKVGPSGAELAAARRLAAQKALEERAAASRAEKMARRQTMQPIPSLREPTVAPRTNRSSMLRENKPLSRTNTNATLNSDRTDIGIKETSPSKTKAMPTPTRYIQPRPAPAPPSARPVSTISFSLPPKQERTDKEKTDRADKRTSIFTKLIPGKPAREGLTPSPKASTSPQTRRASILHSVKLGQ